ncbi:MAG: hypothetical protein LAQ30_14435 [Acidobacteriia bacterium]|nr:hypothetical protein [Terriglobia bacterium]
MDDSRGVWRDFVTGDGGGVLDLIMRVRGGTRQDAVRWLADITGATLDCRAPSSSSRPEYAEVQRRRRDVPYFADAARFMAEGALELLSSTDPKRAAHTTLLAALRVAPEAEYRAWLDERPRWAAALVSAGRARARRLQMGLASYLFSEEANAARNPD